MQHQHPQDAPRRSKSRAVSLTEAARLLGKHRNTLAAWLAEGAPAEQEARRGAGIEWRVDLGAVLEWYTVRAVAAERERLEARHAAELERMRAALEQAEGDTSEPISRSEALRRRAVAEARMAEIAVEQREGTVIERQGVDRVLVALMTATRDRLLGVPHKTAPELAADGTIQGCGSIVDREIREALTDLAAEGQKAAERLKRGKRGAKHARNGTAK